MTYIIPIINFNGKKLEATQNKLWYFLCSEIALGLRKKRAIDTYKHMNASQKHCARSKIGTNEYILCGYII